MFLFLHDKDIFRTDYKNHKVKNEDRSFSGIIDDSSELIKLIQKGNVCVFIHNSDEDIYYKFIINNNLNDMTASVFVDSLLGERGMVLKNFSLSERMGDKLKFSAMRAVLNDVKDICDFSMIFIE